jgi:3-dehydroquinate synthase class II
MRKQFRVILPMLLLLFVAGIGSAAIAQERAGQDQDLKALSGKISQVDASRGLFEVKDSAGNAMAITVTQQTKITKDGKPIQLSELKAGDTVSVEYSQEGGNAVAKSVTVRGKG